MINIGDRLASDFSDPLGVLSDCHRRIERFLGILLHVAADARGAPLSTEQRDALTAALRYFRDAAPLHTADEEHSLFPRLRRARTAAVTPGGLDVLEHDHRAATAQHAEVERLGRCWLDAGTLEPASVEHLQVLLQALEATYRDHITREDRELFPQARQTLSRDELAAVGREMAARRGLQR